MRGKIVAMTILTVWMMVSSMFVGLIGFSSIENAEAGYTTHAPIRINNNTEFILMAVIEGWSGIGTPGNPYIIEGYDINGTGYGYCIYIGNTTVYFEVRDSYLHEANNFYIPPYFTNSGLTMYNVQNGTIFNNTVSLNTDNGIFLSTSSSNTLANNTVSVNTYGIILGTSSNNNTITNNRASNNSYGIILYSSSNNNTITNNIVSNHSDGIILSSFSNNNTITNNIVSNNGIGIRLRLSSNNNTIANNNVSNCGTAIYLNPSNNNTIANNNVSNCGTVINLNFSNNNTIANNTASSNTGYGIFLWSSYNNIIYHNNFINNTYQAEDNTDNGNQWDNSYPMGGNYWSDYGGVDNLKGPNQDIPGNDGIGDTPYIIDADSQDNYPLMEPYTNRTFENHSVLKQGWNLVSIPLIQQDQNLSKVLEMVDGYYDAVQWYDITDPNDLWKHNKIGKPFGNDLSELNETMSFWIHINQPGDTIFVYNGTTPAVNQTIQLYPGWNMVGYPSLSSHNRTTGLNNLTFDTHVDAIYWYDTATQTWHFMDSSANFVPGRGYWVHSKVEAGWEVPL